MIKKDRIAIVVSAVYALFPFFLLLIGEIGMFVSYLVPIFIYWGYRFIKNDISFIKQETDQQPQKDA